MNFHSRRGFSSTPAEGAQSQSLFSRYRYLVSTLLLLNAAIGAYIFFEKPKKTTDVNEFKRKIPDVEEKAPVNETKIETLPSVSVVKAAPDISAEEQRQLFKWILEEKRKIKPANSAEKKRIDEEKAILKQFIRNKEIPSL